MLLEGRTETTSLEEIFRFQVTVGLDTGWKVHHPYSTNGLLLKQANA